jgi:hypothetical protein
MDCRLSHYDSASHRRLLSEAYDRDKRATKSGHVSRQQNRPGRARVANVKGRSQWTGTVGHNLSRKMRRTGGLAAGDTTTPCEALTLRFVDLWLPVSSARAALATGRRVGLLAGWASIVRPSAATLQRSECSAPSIGQRGATGFLTLTDKSLLMVGRLDRLYDGRLDASGQPRPAVNDRRQAGVNVQTSRFVSRFTTQTV